MTFLKATTGGMAGLGRLDDAEAPVQAQGVAETGLLLPAMRPAACVRDPTGVPLTCLIVDDNASFLDAAAGLLKGEGMTIAGVAFAATEALQKTKELQPDVVLVDIMLGSESGIALAYRLAEANPGGPAIILISTHAEADFADLIQEAPVAGFVPKAELSANAIRRLAGA